MRAALRFLIILLSLLITTSSLANFGSFLCKQTDKFSCYKVKRGDSWQKLFTDEDQRDLVMRINRMNTRLYPGLKIAIPKNLENADVMDFSPFPEQIAAPGQKLIIVSINPEVDAWAAYDEQGTLQHWGPVSAARGWCPDMGQGCHTKLGRFAVYRKEGPGCKSTKFPIGRGGAPMPYCMFFNGGFALHGSYEVPGYNASHGCVRLFVPDAEWLNLEFVGDERNIPVIIMNHAP